MGIVERGTELRLDVSYSDNRMKPGCRENVSHPDFSPQLSMPFILNPHMRSSQRHALFLLPNP